jgi:hypothetical protein
MTEWLSDTWASIKTTDVYNNWSLGMVQGLLTKAGIYDTSAGFGTMQKIIDSRGGKFYRKAALTCVDANTGSVHEFNENTSNWTKAVMSSSAI